MPRKDGQNPYRRPGSPFWQILYTDASGRRRRESTHTTHRRVAQAILAERRKEADQRRANIADRYGEHRKASLESLVVAFENHLQAKDRAPHYVRQIVERIRKAVTGAKGSTLGAVELDVPAFLAFVDDVRGKRSATTAEHYSDALRTFGAWIESTGRWPSNPFAKVASGRARLKDKDRVFRRRQLTLAELERLAQSALVRGTQEYAKAHGGRPSPGAEAIAWHGRERATLYLLAGTTGLRAGEIAALRWEDLQLDGDDPCLTLAGRHTKNGDDAELPLQGFMAQTLQQLRDDRGRRQGRPVAEGDRVLPVPDRIPEHVRRDAMHAGLIPSHRPADKRLDFHALRHSCVRILRDLGVPVEITQQVMRHSDVRLTLQTYGSADKEAVRNRMRGAIPAPAVCTSLCTKPTTHGAQRDTTGPRTTTDKRAASRDSRTA